ncbi:MAG: transferase [Ignavibacteria bacterium CG22_combo_CG10-13_8_21_14_all_37_15]|nr:MAG: transferase [Ignavibacteria bacterium CG22_combo_CG10-13_8_21_14_all_37_15]PIQ10760.1 MAG: transferase [Ignavibacteriales bacterium CG18_big_fil_WC_8_21_14_2_50_31_20]
MKWKLLLFGITGAKHSNFYGQTYIYKANNSFIKLGNRLTFRSYPNSNLIGINRNCSLSTLRFNSQIVIGDYCGLSGTVIGAFTKIELGKGVMCGANTLITDSDWHIDDPRSGVCKPITIEDNVWLGEGVKVLKGVTIGKNSVIGAGSIVTKSIPANVIAAGNPCRIIKQHIVF